MSLLDAFVESEVVEPAPLGNSQVRRQVFIAIRNDGARGSGTESDPYNGSTDGLLDELLANVDLVVLHMTIRFGPGLFQTKGWGAHVDDPGLHSLRPAGT